MSMPAVTPCERPLLLLVCFPVSVHSARWVNLARTGPYRIVIFPSVLQPYCLEFGPLRPIHRRQDVQQLAPDEVGVVAPELIESIAASSVEQARGFRHPASAVEVTAELSPSPDSLLKAIRMLRPELLHGMELQHGAYLCLEARQRHGPGFPVWLGSSWGSDTFLYRKLPVHRDKLAELARHLDGFHSDCTRDNAFFSELGFQGRFFPPVAASGGVDLSRYPDPAQLPPPSQRKVLLVKGYHGWAGRGLDILLALHRIAPRIRHFHIRVTHASEAMVRTAEALRREDGLDIVIDPYFPDQQRAIQRLAQARVVIGYGISDGISTTLLESMAVGAFCIQADTACGCEWIRPGLDGLEVPAHDVEALAAAILRAATDDALVDGAVRRNRLEVARRWDASQAAPVIHRGYAQLLRPQPELEEK